MGEILVKGGTVVNAYGRKKADVLIKDGAISMVKDGIEHCNGDVIEASGRYVLPGFIDVHTHPGLPEDLGYEKDTDDFYTETAAAVKGGTTTIFDFAEQSKGERLSNAIKKRRKRASNSTNCNYELHAAITDVQKDIMDQLKEIKSMGINSIKVYTTYGMKLKNRDVLNVMNCCAQLDMVVMVHCEDDDIINFCANEPCYESSRPREAEISMVETVIQYARITGCKVYICHVSCSESINIILKSKSQGVKVYCETCPQYLLLDKSKYNGTKEMTKYMLSPPLREEEDKEILLKACLEGVVDVLSTDHCAFLYHEHKANFFPVIKNVAKGMPGIQLRGSLMYDLLVEKNGLSIENFVKLMSYNPAEIFGMEDRGRIEEGMLGNVVVWGRQKIKVAIDDIIEGTDYSPYEGMELVGRPEITLI